MLIEFRVVNFRSFKEAQTFSMVAGAFSEHMKTNTFDPKINGFDEKLLRSSAIYGANAAGKTNLLRAIQYMQAFILNSANPMASLPFTPFKFSSSTRDAPSEFEITFVRNGTRYEYGFAVGAERVEKEWLVEFINPRGRVIFKRTYDRKTKKYEWNLPTFLKGQRIVWKESTRPNALFLSTAVQLNSKQLMPVYEWFQKHLVVIADATKFNASLTLGLFEEKNGKEKLLSFMKEADLAITDLKLERKPLPTNGQFVFQGKMPILEHKPGQLPNQLEIAFSHPSDDENYSTLDLSEESNGTQIFFSTAGGWINVIKNGEVILCDEIEASFHPRLVRFLIERFHSEKNNPQNSQLIFTTQSPTLLDQELFRRDQFWFVEKDRNGTSKVYPLTDFKPRNDEVLERWYMRGRYGALPLIELPEE